MKWNSDHCFPKINEDRVETSSRTQKLRMCFPCSGGGAGDLNFALWSLLLASPISSRSSSSDHSSAPFLICGLHMAPKFLLKVCVVLFRTK